MKHAPIALPNRSVPPSPVDQPPGFAIDVDVRRSLVRYTLSGFFDDDAIALFKEQQANALRTLCCARNQHVSIIDISACKIQSREMVAQFSALLGDDRYRSRVLAVVVGGSLARMQIHRILARPDVGYFTTVAEAIRWLFSAGAGSAAPDRSGD